MNRYLKANGSKFSRAIFLISVLIQGRNPCFFLALSWNIPLLKLLLIAMTKVFQDLVCKTFADSFISFGGTLPIHVDFLLSIFSNAFLHQIRNLWKIAVSSCENVFYVIFFYIFDSFMINKRLTNYLYCFFYYLQFPVLSRLV